MLSAAAQGSHRHRYATAADDVRRAERAVDAALDDLSQRGYRVR
jgi:hypothetical protein